jgi:cell division protein FtsI (penicillin-binding protein 3)
MTDDVMQQNAQLQMRMKMVMVAFAFLWALLLLRTFYVQVLQQDYYAGRVENQSVRRAIWEPERGRLLSRDGQEMATNGQLSAKSYKNRVYPFVGSAAQLVGVLGRDGEGKLGLERSLDEYLRGVEGWRYNRVDAHNRAQPGMTIEGRPPRPGLDAYLTIDMEIQEIAELALKRGVEKQKALRGYAVVVDPHSGEILAMANYPDFDPNSFRGLVGDATRNGSVAFVYEPGSTFKLITTAAVVEEKTWDMEKSISGDNGRYVTQGGQVISDHHAHGMMSMYDAVAYSSNVAFAKLSVSLGKKRFYKYARDFGFGMSTGIHLPGEERGLLKSLDKWSGRTLETMAMGHEIMSTPLQVAMAYSAVANGGELLKPRVVKYLRDPENGEIVESFPRQVVRRVVSGTSAAQVRELLKGVVEYGTASHLRSEWLEIAGKTGTAEKVLADGSGYDKGRNVASFVGMVPASNPRFVCLVVMDEPKQRFGGSTAGPVFREIVDKIYMSPRLTPETNRLVFEMKKGQIEVDDWMGRERAELEKAPIKYPVRIHNAGNRIVSQSLPAGAKLRMGDTLQLWTADVQEGVMPDLEGLSLREALSVLQNHNVDVAYKGSGVVVKQDPIAGSEIKAQAKCHLRLGEKS